MAADPDLDPRWIDEVRGGLLAWYARGHRDLPWRRDRDPYRILVSETMLVQTTAAAVAPHFERFLARFPDVQALAGAPEDDVLKAWEGLGYYRRARQLHAAAKVIVRDHGGAVPADPEAIRGLPGVGRYIAGAVLSFAFDRPAPILEANTQRVLARLLAWPEVLTKSSSQNRLWQAAERLVPPVEPGTFNQAFMELGATACTPRAPMCLLCPVAGACRARAEGLQEAIPARVARPSPLEVVEACALVSRSGGLLAVRRAPGRLWGGFWEFPTIHVSGADPAGRAFDAPTGLEGGVHRLTGVAIAAGPPARTCRFGVTKYRVSLSAHIAKDCGGETIPYSGFSDVRFLDPGALSRVAMGSAMRKLANWAVAQAL